MRERLRLALLSLLVIAGTFALGGCEDDEEEEEAAANSGTLVIDDDRTAGLPMTVFIALGSETPTSVTMDFGTTRILQVVQGTYTITFDDNGTSGINAGDTAETAVQILTGKTTTVEYVAPGNSTPTGPLPQANG